MAMIKYSDKVELKICLDNAKNSEDIFNNNHIIILEKLLAMLEYSGTIYLNKDEFSLLGHYR